MKPIHYLVLWALAGVVGILSCQWESEEDLIDPCNSTITWTPVPPDTCFELPISPLGFVNATSHWPLLSKPHFCPYDSYRFLYVVSQFEGDTTKINTINLCTGEKQQIATAKSMYIPRWGGTDWVLFSSGFGPIQKVKSTGGSLTILNPITGMSRYFWINDGQTIQTKLGNNINILMNLSGEIIDTLPISIGLGAFKNNRIATGGSISSQAGTYIGYVNTDNWQFTPLAPYNGSNSPSSIDWLDDHHIVWCNIEGIRKVNINSGEIFFIKETPCENLRYRFISASQNNSGRILTTRLDYIYVKPDSLVKYERISLIDAHTGQEWILGLE
ncbi:MAG: hypothetical protein JNK77_05270 [Saprospiraceae bacterium]|nr:hypothetical protein [Saprospiraceae bacterium]NUQ23643.1 hypothetical protein [Saprospiraceae bacterium]